MNRKLHFSVDPRRVQPELSSRIPYVSKEQARALSRPCSLFIEPAQAVSVGVRRAGSAIGARPVGGGVTWFPHPGQMHPDLVSRDAPRGGCERGRGCQLMISNFISTSSCSFGAAMVTSSAAWWPGVALYPAPLDKDMEILTEH